VDFPVVFVDEASMATEPNALIPLTKGVGHNFENAGASVHANDILPSVPTRCADRRPQAVAAPGHKPESRAGQASNEFVRKIDRGE
jgi:hypothetical protein